MRHLSIVCALGCAVFAGNLASAEEKPPVQPAKELTEPKVAEKALNVSLEVDVVTAYVYRGYNNEDGGLIVQPDLRVSLTALSSDQLTIKPFVDFWGSIHSQKTNAGRWPEAWYELDVTLGAEVQIGKFTLTPNYIAYMSPSDAFDTVQEIGLVLAYNDTDFMKSIGIPFGLNPRIAWTWEIDDRNGSEDQYAEIGITPAFEIPLGGKTLNLAVPVTAGFSPDGYYLKDSGHNQVFGYWSIGAQGTYELLKSDGGTTVSLIAGLTYVGINADSAQASNKGDSWIVLGKVGVLIGF